MRAVVVGAGAVGLATARELARSDAFDEVFVLEAAAHPGAGTTSRNSGVVHAGLYYPPGSLKARLCVEGAALLYDYLARSAIPHRRCGKLVVASDASEVPALEALARNAVEAGAEGLETVDGSEARRRQPAVRCAAALVSPRTGILDAAALVRALRGDVERAGGTVALHARVVGAEPRVEGGYRLEVDRGGERERFECDAVVNSAGLEADLVARLPLGEAAGPASHRYVRGSYARVWWPKSATPPPDCLVYPLPNRDAPGLGIHLTVDLSGGLRLGPDAEELGRRVEDYAVSDEILPRFEAAARRYLDLPEGVSFSPDFAGIRPVRDDVAGPRDFYVAEESGRGLPLWVNLLGIESPGLTASLAIGRLAAALLEA